MATPLTSIVGDQFQEISDRPMRLDGVPQGKLLDDLIVVSSPDPLTLNESPLLKLLNDSLNGTLGNPNPERNLSQHQVRL